MEFADSSSSPDSVLDLLFDDVNPLIANDYLLPSPGALNVSWDLFDDLLATNSQDADFVTNTMKELPDALLQEPPPDFQPLSSSSNSSASFGEEILVDHDASCVSTNINVFIDVDKEGTWSSPDQDAPSTPEQASSNSDEVAEIFQADETSVIVIPFYCGEIVEDVRLEINDGDAAPTTELKLTPEEKRLLAKEGISLPTCYPLTKDEERDLKKIRRKIRNKHSAQDSRKKKKVYMDGLESRVKNCTDENNRLKNKLEQMEIKNKSLLVELRKMQSAIAKYGNQHAHASTCMVVLLLSFAFIISPNLWPFAKPTKELSPGFTPGNSRVLLSHPSSYKASLDEPGTDEAVNHDGSDAVRWTDRGGSYAVANNHRLHYSTIAKTNLSDQSQNASAEDSKNNSGPVAVPVVS